MHKKFTLGNGEAFLADFDTKTKIIDWLYSNLDLSKHRYVILNNTMKLKFLQETPHYVSPNFKGFNYLILFLTLNDKKYCVAIDRRKLSYHKNQLDMKTIQVIMVNVKTSDSIFRGTIFDGKLIQTNNEYIFLIQDSFLLMGTSMLDMKMDIKMNHIDTIMKTHFKKDKEKYCRNFEFKLNKLYNYDELENMITNLPTMPFSTMGIIFYPPTSGITVLHMEKKIEKVEFSSTTTNIEQKTYDIINNFVDFLKSRTYSYETGKNSIMWLSRTIVPDVYDIFEKEDGDKLGIALIPNLKTSHMCDDLIKDKMIKFNCCYSNKFKKWIPLQSV